MQTSKMAPTPMSTTCKLSEDETGPLVKEKLYRAMIGSLLYLTASRSDICHSFGVCACYQASTPLSDLAAAKRILKYVKVTIEHGLYIQSKLIRILQDFMMQIGQAILRIITS